ncbi:peptidoglycan/xylan/chitin deacetylase (PgdA/CDA1 family) [Kitasatospora sp. SolWspMP-SS2h]|uniref:polysaccharide deacetylase family protein n=1 Tax=Kitasatospora sp. SolWspMP-SS2h TaxID=1305729 RepID=UPI000DB9D0DD|nr:polysaccharide deacetylase family protein [Kitasatospora sp. SolWspMP-SS2h]RAJ47202.1 peptidoglycan/xylan/chitin deacetylase (PgdA/CDA1 family) [Kitasatospora sp. SolWspMP-SS2h]
MKLVKRRPRFHLLLGVAVLAVAALVTVAVIRSFAMVTVSPGQARKQAKGAPVAGQADCAREKCIALTFDGSPGEPTGKVMDLLAEYRAPATFFLEGRDLHSHPDVVRRIAAEGHEIGDHTWTHPRLTEVSDAQVRDELGRTADAIEELTGRRPTLMRPPEGRTDDRVSAISRELGMAQVLWTVTAQDYATDDTALITRRVLDGAARDGIVLLHPLHAGTVPALPAVLKSLSDQGYTFVTVDQLLAPGTARPGTVYR